MIPENVLAEIQGSLSDVACSQKAIDILRGVIEKAFLKIKQAALARITDNTKDVVVQMTTELGQKLLNVAEGWNRDINHNLILYPENTRFVARKVGTTIVVVEHKPQLRTMQFHHNVNAENYQGEGVHRFRLALPYVVFFIVFKTEGTALKFAELRVAFRNEPLTSMSNTLGRPPLPNVNSDLKVCMGSSFNNRIFTGNLCEQTNQVISHFLNSQFNKDIIDEYKKVSEEDPRFMLQNWAKESKKDQLWVLERQWTPSGTLEAHLDQHSGNAPVNITAMLQSEVNALVSTVSDRLKRSLDAVNVGKVSQGELTKQFADVLKDLIQEVQVQLWDYCEAKLVSERAASKQALEDAVRKELSDLRYYTDVAMAKKKKWTEDGYLQ